MEWISVGLQTRWNKHQKKVFENTFWKKGIEVVKIVESLVRELWFVDGEKLAMGYINEAMDQGKEHIRASYKDRVAQYGLGDR
jgi:hypothetical protein